MNPEEEKQLALWRQQKHLEIRDELLLSEVVKTFLEKLSPSARDGYIEDYAREKVQWLEWGEQMKEWNEKEDFKWIDDATKRLKEIQQKKLFDLQCLWRAEKIELPDVKLTWEFKYWEDNILNCPFLSPVSEGEFELYLQYLQSSNFENEQGWLDRWQDYEEIKEAYNTNSGRNFPDWYDFHNGRTGSSVYMILPDIRGEKEEFYLQFWRDEISLKQREANEQKMMADLLAETGTESEELNAIAASQEKVDTRPWLDFHKKGWLTWFVNTYEDKETQEKFAKYGGERSFDDYDDLLEDDLELLSKADKEIPIEGWFDWKEAIHKAAENYRKEKIIESMPVAFERYKLNIDQGISFEEVDGPFKKNDWYESAILRGRELNGEPRDLNF